MKYLFAVLLCLGLAGVSYAGCPGCHTYVVPRVTIKHVPVKPVVIVPRTKVRTVTRVRSGLFHRFVSRAYVGP